MKKTSSFFKHLPWIRILLIFGLAGLAVFFAVADGLITTSRQGSGGGGGASSNFISGVATISSNGVQVTSLATNIDFKGSFGTVSNDNGNVTVNAPAGGGGTGISTNGGSGTNNFLSNLLVDVFTNIGLTRLGGDVHASNDVTVAGAAHFQSTINLQGTLFANILWATGGITHLSWARTVGPVTNEGLTVVTGVLNGAGATNLGVLRQGGAAAFSNAVTMAGTVSGSGAATFGSSVAAASLMSTGTVAASGAATFNIVTNLGTMRQVGVLTADDNIRSPGLFAWETALSTGIRFSDFPTAGSGFIELAGTDRLVMSSALFTYGATSNHFEGHMRIVGDLYATTIGANMFNMSTGNLGIINLTNALGMASGGTGSSLTDPNADRILFWDNSVGSNRFLAVGTGLTLTDTTLTADAAGTLTVKTNGVTLGSESTLNLVAGANVTLTGITGTGSNQVTIAASGGGASGPVTNAQFSIVIDGGGSVITTGAKGWGRAKDTFTITGWDITADQSGSAVVDVWKDTYANFPPTVADTIAGSELPTLSAEQKNQDVALGTWTTAVTKGDYIRVNINSASTVTYLVVTIYGY